MCWRSLSWLFVLTVAISTFTTHAATELELNEDDSMIVELRLGSYMLLDAMIVYAGTDNTMVSLQEFVDGLEFAITVDSETQQASGWFIHPKNTFELNIKTAEVHIRGVRSELGDDFVFYADDFDLFVDTRYLMSWFDVEIQLQMARLIMQVSTDQTLPVEQRVIREKKRSKNTSKRSNTRSHPWVEDSYLWFGPPSIDIKLNATYSETEDTRWGYSFQTTSDLLKHESRISHIQTDQFTPTNTRMMFTKKALRPDQTLAHGFTRYDFGDIYAPGDSLVSLGSPGLGISVERQLSAALDQSFNRRDFEGDAPPGWEIELYRNGLFINFQVVDESGRYLFQDIEVQYGENFFEIKRYGPQGQVEIEKTHVQIGREMITPGEWQFSATFLREKDQLIGEPLLPSAQIGDSPPESIAITGLYGLFDQHSFGLGFNRVPASFRTEEKDFARLIWIAAYPRFSSRMDIAKDAEAGTAMSLNITGRLFNQDMNLETIQFQEFLSPQSNYGNTKQKSKFSLFGNLQAFNARQIPYSFGVTASELTNGSKRLSLENRLSLFLGRNRFSNELVSTKTSNDEEFRTRGVFSFNRSSGALQFRTNLTYSVKPKEITNASVTIDYKRPKWRTQLSANSTINDDGNLYSMGLNLSKTFGHVTVALSANTDFEENSNVALTMDIGLNGLTRKPYFKTAKYGSTGAGALEARVYLDENANGIFDDDEIPLENIRFKGRSSWFDRETNEDGIVVLDGLDTTLGSVVSMDTVSLNDPYLLPTMPSFRVASHSGAYRKVDVPVTAVTEVEGYVYLSKGDSLKGVGGITIGLFKDGVEILRAVAEFDGYYLFPKVAPGTYTTSIVDDTGGMSKYTWNSSPRFKTDIESGITKAGDILVREKEESDASVEASGNEDEM